MIVRTLCLLSFVAFGLCEGLRGLEFEKAWQSRPFVEAYILSTFLNPYFVEFVYVLFGLYEGVANGVDLVKAGQVDLIS